MYFVREAGLWRLQDGSEPERLWAGPVGSFVLARDGIYFDQGSGDYTRASLNFYQFQTGTAELIRHFDLKKSGGLALSPDGANLLIALNERQVSELLLIR